MGMSDLESKDTPTLTPPTSHAGETTISVDLVVNGHKRSAAIPVRTSLADLLRDYLGLTGTHVGCEQGVCGSCNVFVNGVSTRSCLFLAAQANSTDVVTIEGLSPPVGLSAVQQAISDHHGLQCGFCTPGFVVTITEMAASRRLLTMDDQQVRDELGGNLCRCTGYQGLVEATLQIRDQLRDETS